MKRGVVGVVVLPLASLLETAARTAESVRSAVAGASSAGWVRPPRYVHPSLPLAPYNWSEAMGRWLLAGLERGAGGQPPRSGAAAAAHRTPLLGSFVLCAPLVERNKYLVVTSKVGARGGGGAPHARRRCSGCPARQIGPRLTPPALRRSYTPPPPRSACCTSRRASRCGCPRCTGPAWWQT